MSGREFKEGLLEGFGEQLEWNRMIDLFKLFIAQTDYTCEGFFELFRDFSQAFAKEFLDKDI